MNPSIFIGLPHRGNIRFEHVPNIIEWSKSYPIALGSSTMYPIAGARNELVDFFLQTKCTHISFLDSDTIMPRDGLPRLLSHGKDVISGIYALRVGEQKSQEENKDCSNYLGCCINEQILKHVMPNAILMDNCNPGYDLICGKGYLVDAKSSTLLHNEHKNPYWHFNIRKNKIPDYFLLTAYKDRESLEILYMWLIPGKDINNRSGLSISEKCTSKWENYKIDHINAINYLHTIELPDGKA